MVHVDLLLDVLAGVGECPSEEVDGLGGGECVETLSSRIESLFRGTLHLFPRRLVHPHRVRHPVTAAVHDEQRRGDVVAAGKRARYTAGSVGERKLP
ncbi:hypothetical protein IAE22_31090, partial [Bacillus sp. S34]|nr:hypothetical protein [Bacillus sp. S34]